MKLFISILLVVTSVFVQAQDVDTELSKVSFKISNLKVNKVKGEITGMTGRVDLAKGLIDVCIKPVTISTGIKKRDEHLRTADFFNVEKYPEICFEAQEVEKTGDGYLAKGKLTLHGVTNDVAIPLVANGKNIQGEFEVNRFDYGLGAESFGGTFQIGETATVKINCVLK